MANPAEFPEANGKLDSGQEGIKTLPVYKDEQGLISCHELSDEEIEAIRRTKKVWLMVLGHEHPPVAVLGQSPFKPGPRIVAPSGKTINLN